MRWAFLTVAVASVALADAQAVLSAADADLAAGDFEQALKRVEAELKRSSSPHDLAQLQLAKGRALLAMGKRDKALAAFVAALKRDVSVELDAERAGPDARALLEKARASLPATAAVTVKGGEGTVQVDGRDMGPAPLVIQLEQGKHVLTVRAPDGREVRRELEVSEARRIELELELPAVAVTAPVEPPSPPAQVSRPGRRSAGFGLVPLFAGAAVTLAGVAALGVARAEYNALANPAAPALSAEGEAAHARTGATLQTVGWVGFGVGVAAMAAGVALLLFSPGSEVRASVLLSPSGAAVGLSGPLPY